MTPSKDMKPLTDFGKVFWQNQFRTTINLPDGNKLPSLKDKVAIISGANSGLGFEAAKHLLTLNLSHLIIAVRSLPSGREAASVLQSLQPKARIDVWWLDMESYKSIQEFVKRCDSELPHIEYVILNAGLSTTTFTKARSTGHEMDIQVNHISTALLTVLLLPILRKKSSPDRGCARMTIVNSLTAHLCKFPNRDQRPLLNSFDDTTLVPWDAQERYGVSKLLNQLFMVKLADLVHSEDVIINMVDPGLTKGTNLSRDATGLLRMAAKLFFNVCGRPLNRGAATYIHALLEQGPESHGSFLMSNKIAPLAGIYYTSEGKQVSQQIWDETLDELSFANARESIASMH